MASPTPVPTQAPAPTATPAPTNSTGADVRAYGAIGDGAADDTAAIQAAFNAGTSDVFFPAGTYSITTISIPATTGHVYGSGATIKQRSLGLNPFYVTGSRASTLTIELLTFQGIPGTAYAGWNNGVYIFATSNVTVHNSTFTGFRLHGVFAENSQNINVTDNTVYGVVGGIRYSGIQGGSISRNTVRDPSTPDATFTIAIGLDSSADRGFPNTTNITVADNTVSNYVNAQAIMVHDGQHVTITGNVLNNVLIGVDLVGGGIAVVPGYLDKVDDITVSGNTYNGTLVPGPRGTFANAGIRLSGASDVHVTNVTVTNNQVNDANAVLREEVMAGIHLGYADNATVTGNTIRRSYTAGISLGNPNTNVSIKNNMILIVYANTVDSPTGMRIGIYKTNYGGPTTGCASGNTIDTVSYVAGAYVPTTGLAIGPNTATNVASGAILDPGNLTISASGCS
jgi:parallel beta-helix repeat protein